MNASDRIRMLRESYVQGALDEASIARDPLEQFNRWLHEALAAELVEANAMTLATVDARAQPAARIVLLRGYDERGFTFFTNYLSRKGRELGVQAQAALLFYWGPLERQVRIEGIAEPLPPAESDAYFASRPRAHQLGAWTSAQSTVVPDRAFLEERLAHFEQTFEGREVPRPAHWGGYRLTPQRFEFWQGRPSRVHDRISFERSDEGWIVRRLAP